MEEAPLTWNTDLLSRVFLGMAELSRLTHLILGLTFSWNQMFVIDVFVSCIPLPAKVTLTLFPRSSRQLAESFR